MISHSEMNSVANALARHVVVDYTGLIFINSLILINSLISSELILIQKVAQGCVCSVFGSLIILFRPTVKLVKGF